MLPAPSRIIFGLFGIATDQPGRMSVAAGGCGAVHAGHRSGPSSFSRHCAASTACASGNHAITSLNRSLPDLGRDCRSKTSILVLTGNASRCPFGDSEPGRWYLHFDPELRPRRSAPRAPSVSCCRRSQARSPHWRSTRCRATRWTHRTVRAGIAANGTSAGLASSIPLGASRSVRDRCVLVGKALLVRQLSAHGVDGVEPPDVGTGTACQRTHLQQLIVVLLQACLTGFASSAAFRARRMPPALRPAAGRLQSSRTERLASR